MINTGSNPGRVPETPARRKVGRYAHQYLYKGES